MKYVINIILFIALLSCEINHTKHPLIPGVKDNYKIYIISEKGCMTCNKKYLNYIVSNVINKDNSIIYSAASGMQLDISLILSDTVKNLIKIDKTIWKRYNIEEGSYFINIRDNQVDTIIHIQPNNIAESLEYLQQY